jgi:hypothetical protein
MVAEGETPNEKQATAFGSGRASAGTESVGGSLDDVGKNLGTAYAAALTYVSTQLHRVRVGVRHLIIFSFFAAVAALFFLGVMLTATVLLLIGLAGGISGLLNIPIWAGQLITAMLAIGAIILSVLVIIARMTKAARRRTISSYERPSVHN